MTTVRIAHAEPRPGRMPNGGFQTRGHLVVLADDARRRAVPIWMRGDPGAGDLAQLVESARQPASEIVTANAPQVLTARLLGAAEARVTEVDIEAAGADVDELSPQVTVARIRLAGAAGTRDVTADLGLGLALAAAAGAPVRLADALLDRVAVPVPGDDLLTPFLDRVPPVARALAGHGLPGWPTTVPGHRPRFEPRNLDFTDGLGRWDLDSGFRRDAEPSQDYAAAADGEGAVLSSAVPRPAGSAALVQTIFADDYRGATVVFRGDIHAERLTGQAGLRLEILRHWWRVGRAREDHAVTVSGGRGGWTTHEVTAVIPEDAELIRFGIGLSGPGRIWLRNPDLRRAVPDDDWPVSDA
jgi:hypothetical protein